MNRSMDEPVLLGYFAKTASKEEKEEIERWLSLSEENREIARQIGYVYFACQLLQTNGEVDIPKELSNVRAKTNRRKRFSVWKKRADIAAVLLLPLAGFFLYITDGDVSGSAVGQLVEVHVKQGSVKTVLLPDSSLVYLNSGAYLRYPVHFVENRSVYLQGEAYFVVKKAVSAALSFILRQGPRWRCREPSLTCNQSLCMLI